MKLMSETMYYCPEFSWSNCEKPGKPRLACILAEIGKELLPNASLGLYLFTNLFYAPCVY
jgi:hypothetical protein